MKLCNKDSLATHCGLNLVVMGMKNGTVNKTVSKLMSPRKEAVYLVYIFIVRYQGNTAHC